MLFFILLVLLGTIILWILFLFELGVKAQEDEEPIIKPRSSKPREANELLQSEVGPSNEIATNFYVVPFCFLFLMIIVIFV
jgi:hypothetical protein